MHRYGRGDGASGFASSQLAQQLRALAFRSHGMQLPAAGQLPKTITVFKAAEREEVCRSPLMGLISAHSLPQQRHG